MRTPRLSSLDALRGLAALAVVLSHVAEPGGSVGSAELRPAAVRWLAEVLAHGRVGVVLFFVISGFCIHLRWARARAEGRDAAVDFASFWRQRFTRLYPPYLVAMAIYLAIETWSGVLIWDLFAGYDLMLHLLMLHNVDARTVFSIVGVFWTLAIEEQLYLAYFLLLPLRSRLGWPRTLAICAGARVAWFALAFAVGQWGGGEFRLSHDSGSLAHWFSWSLGALCVEAMVGLVTLPAWAARGRYAALCFLLAVGCDYATGHHLGGGLGWRLTWLVGSPLWVVGFFVLVNRLVRVEAAWRAAGAIPRPVTLLAGLGLFSYSLYLTHNLVLKHLGPPLLGWLGLSNGLGGRLMLVPLTLALAWAFFRASEQPALNWAARYRSVDPGPVGTIANRQPPRRGRRLASAD